MVHTLVTSLFRRENCYLDEEEEEGVYLICAS